VPFAARHGLRASDLRALLPGLPHLLACQALLALLAASRPGTARLLAWERPWRRACARPGGDRVGAVTFPAGAELAWPDGCGAYLLLPEGSPPAAHRSALGGLLRRRAAGVAVPPLLIVAARPHPADAWHRLLEEVARAAGEAPLQGWIAAPDELPCLRDLGAGRGAGGPTQLVLPLGAGGRRPAIGEPFRPSARAGADCRRGDAVLALAPADRALLDAVGRHPCLPPDRLATVLGCGGKWARERCSRLARLGFLDRLVHRPRGSDEALELAVLTRAGARLVAAAHGLSLGQAARHLGLVWWPASRRRGRRPGPRDELFVHLDHTLEADALFVDLLAGLRARAAAGGDDALVEWRNAPACARGRLRPDGYGLVRHNGALYGFLLEYERGTAGAGRLRTKFRSYARYRADARAVADFAGFPTVLVVAADYRVERAIAAVLRVLTLEMPSAEPLPVLLTTRERLAGHPDGMLGPVWRGPSSPARRVWPLAATAATTMRRELGDSL
jgi:hypothetical protein